MAEKHHYLISEVAQMYGVSTPTLRHWERQFAQLRPDRNSKGRRYYTREQVAVVAKIFALVHEQGMSIDGAKKQLKLRSSHIDRAHEAVERLTEIRQQLCDIIKEL